MFIGVKQNIKHYLYHTQFRDIIIYHCSTKMAVIACKPCTRVFGRATLREEHKKSKLLVGACALLA